jgi:hypothetical protein
MNRATFLFAGLLMLAGAGGCTKSGPELVPIAGTVTHNGQPVPNLRIIFQPEHGRISWGSSDANGRFVLHYDADHEGAKVDNHTVYVAEEGANVDPTAAMAGAKSQKRLPELAAAIAKYGPEKSTLNVEVKKADRNFQLKLD